MICSSCRNGFNGRNGNGYQPCSCHTGRKKLYATAKLDTSTGAWVVVDSKTTEKPTEFKKWFDSHIQEGCDDLALSVAMAWAKLAWDYKEGQIKKMMPKGG